MNAIFVSVSLALAMAALPPGEVRGDVDECVVVRHIGFSDKPIPTLIICAGPERPMDWSDFRAVFSVSPSELRAYEEFVRDHVPARSSTSDEFRALRVTSPGDEANRKYVVRGDEACDYLLEFSRVAQRQRNDELTEMLLSVRGQYRCP